MRPLDYQTVSVGAGSLSNFEHTDGPPYSSDPLRPQEKSYTRSTLRTAVRNIQRVSRRIDEDLTPGLIHFLLHHQLASEVS
jgi:hypothetical protein